MPEQNGSIQSYLTAEIKKRQAGEIQKIPVPRMPRLLIKYKALDDRSLIKLGIESQEGDDPVQALIDASINSLLASSIGSESDRGDDIGLPLGAALAAFLELGDCVNPDPHKADREGVYLVFQSERDIVEVAGQLGSFQSEANQRVAEDIVGKSQEAVEETG